MAQKKAKLPPKISPTEAAQFLESFRLMLADKDQATQMISLRIPQNILASYKTLAKSQGKKYQSLLNEALRDYLKKSPR